MKIHSNTFNDARRFATAAAAELVGMTHIPKVSDEEVQRRWKTCLSCSELVNEVCRLCGCRMRIKTTWRTAVCDANKW